MNKLLTTIFLIISISVFGQTEGPNSPTSWGATITADNDWTDGAEIYTSDDTEAYAIADVTDTEALAAMGYGFSIPAGATIDGVEVLIRKRYDPCCGSGNIRDRNVKLVIAGTISGLDRKTVTDWTSTFTDVTYGSPTDLWGLALTPADINDANFGISMKVKRQGGGSNRYADIDYMSITVYYTVPLPVELIDFNVEQSGKTVNINWSTASEVNNDYFMVEKSTDAIEFEEVTKIDGVGNSSFESSYEAVDYYPSSGVNYYRLKQVDFDGATEYSPIESVEYSPIESGSEHLIVYPNPTQGEFHVKGTYLPQEEILVVVNDLTGKEWYSKIVVTDMSGKFYTAIDPYDRIPSGIYIVMGAQKDYIYSQILVIE